MANHKIHGLLWMLLILVTSLFPRINAYQGCNVVIDEEQSKSEQISIGEDNTKISQVPYMASYCYEGEFYEYPGAARQRG